MTIDDVSRAVVFALIFSCTMVVTKTVHAWLALWRTRRRAMRILADYYGVKIRRFESNRSIDARVTTAIAESLRKGLIVHTGQQ